MTYIITEYFDNYINTDYWDISEDGNSVRYEDYAAWDGALGLYLHSSAGINSGRIDSVNTYNMRNSFLYFKMSAVTQPFSGEFFCSVSGSEDDGQLGAYAIKLTGTSLSFLTAVLSAPGDTDPSIEESGPLTYNATNHAWLRVTVTEGAVVFYTSANGTTWTQQYASERVLPTLDMCKVRFQVTSSTVTSSTLNSLVIDNILVNIPLMPSDELDPQDEDQWSTWEATDVPNGVVLNPFGIVSVPTEFTSVMVDVRTQHNSSTSVELIEVPETRTTLPGPTKGTFVVSRFVEGTEPGIYYSFQLNGSFQVSEYVPLTQEDFDFFGDWLVTWEKTPTGIKLTVVSNGETEILIDHPYDSTPMPMGLGPYLEPMALKLGGYGATIRTINDEPTSGFASGMTDCPNYIEGLGFIPWAFPIPLFDPTAELSTPPRDCFQLLEVVRQFSKNMFRPIRITGANTIEMIDLCTLGLPVGFLPTEDSLYVEFEYADTSGAEKLSLKSRDVERTASAVFKPNDVRILASGWKIPQYLPSPVGPASVKSVTYSFTPKSFNAGVEFHFIPEMQTPTEDPPSIEEAS